MIFNKKIPIALLLLLPQGNSLIYSNNIETTKTSISKQVSLLKARMINPTTVELIFTNQERMSIDFYGEDIFRLFMDPQGGIIRDPKAKPPADILVKNPRKTVNSVRLSEEENNYLVNTQKITLVIDKLTGTFKVLDRTNDKIVLETIEPISFSKKGSQIALKENEEEYFFGGGVQNGRFSHKGNIIEIENQNSWTDGGVASPTPYYWSTNGYGVMWHTFKKGQYDFGGTQKGKVRLGHQEEYLDAFFMVGNSVEKLLNGYYQLTGNPLLIPKFGFYTGHLNAYNRDYWTENEDGILFEDGKRYKESQKQNEGARESLNGESDYQFSARAVIDRYEAHDMPFGWILPNDGYGAGYGQDSTLDGNIQNLRELSDYANEKGIEVGLWTQSDLHPKDGVNALLQRDLVKEVRDAKVRILKTDVAWVGAGYSFGLNGIADAAEIMTYYGNDCRPFIITLDGWAGTQRYGGVWSGDQSGGEWEYIRFHIPTYLGAGLSGQPNITSDLDGIFGGKKPIINIRDYQWKTFTPMGLNMDGWGANAKYPHALGEPAASINRWYLKLKAELLPYAYSVAKSSVDGLPMMRAMFLVEPNPYTLDKHTQYQFLYGPSILVAPIYQDTQSDEEGNDIRNGIYLPDGEWIDYFTGDVYAGGRIINNFDAPIWKLPVFIKSGSIIPRVNTNNNVGEINQNLRIFEIYPSKTKTTFTNYDDDGRTMNYTHGIAATTEIETLVSEKGEAQIHIHPTEGGFDGFVPEKMTELIVNMTGQPGKIKAKVAGKKIKLQEAKTLEEYNAGQNIYFYEQSPNMNKFATAGSDFAKVEVIKNPQLLIKLASSDITTGETEVSIQDYEFNSTSKLLSNQGKMVGSLEPQVTEENLHPYKATPSWDAVNNADYYEIEFDNQLYSTIKATELEFENLLAETDYAMKVRGVNKDGFTDWEEFSFKTMNNPLEFAIPNIKAECSVTGQGSNQISKMFDYDEKNTWHTKWSLKAVPFDFCLDLQGVNTLDRLEYLPQVKGGNGTLLEGKIYYSMNKDKWVEAGAFVWEKSGDTKVFAFNNNPKARYIKFEITKAVGNFGSGREMYVFKQPNTPTYIQGDINNDKKIDNNDLTSFTNYTGLRLGDADFQGYISQGDINENNLIDAYDISYVSTALEGGIEKVDSVVGGTLTFDIPKNTFKKGDIVEIKVNGENLVNVNALSFAIPYDKTQLEYVSITPVKQTEMVNMTYDRLHTNGQKALYPTFTNLGDKPRLNGSDELFIIKMKVLKNGPLNIKVQDGILVDNDLNKINF